MKLPDNYLPRDGDELLVKGTVKYNATANEMIVIDIKGAALVDKEALGYYTAIAVNRESVFGIATPRIKVGDKVRGLVLDEGGIVLAIHGDYLWIDTSYGKKTGHYAHRHISQVERIDQPVDAGMHPMRDHSADTSWGD